MSGTLVFAAATQEMPLQCLALDAGGRAAGVLGSPRIATTGETDCGRLPPPGHCTDSRLKHTPSLLVKRVHSLVLEFQPEGVKLSITVIIS